MKDSEIIFRPLLPEEIEIRPARITDKSVTLLLYTRARACMKLLDEAVGPFGWEREHVVVDGNLYCKVSVYDPNNRRWVSKMDVGTESYMEKEKGESSDSFKRACVNWGIGRELYTAPVIRVSRDDIKIGEQDGKTYIRGDLYVSNIEYVDGVIDLLEITQNVNNEATIIWQRKHLSTADGYPKPPVMIATLQNLFSDEREDVQAWLQKMYGVSHYGELTDVQLKVIYNKKCGEQR